MLEHWEQREPKALDCATHHCYSLINVGNQHQQGNLIIQSGTILTSRFTD